MASNRQRWQPRLTFEPACAKIKVTIWQPHSQLGGAANRDHDQYGSTTIHFGNRLEEKVVILHKHKMK